MENGLIMIEGLKAYNPAPSKHLNLIYKKYFKPFKPSYPNMSNIQDIRFDMFDMKWFDIKDISGLVVFLDNLEDPAPFLQITTRRK